MRKWWNNVRLVEAFIKGWQRPGQQEHSFTPPEAREAIEQQQITYEAARWYGRKKLRRELQKINHKMLREHRESGLVRAVEELWGGRKV